MVFIPQLTSEALPPALPPAGYINRTPARFCSIHEPFANSAQTFAKPPKISKMTAGKEDWHLQKGADKASTPINTPTMYYHVG